MQQCLSNTGQPHKHTPLLCSCMDYGGADSAITQGGTAPAKLGPLEGHCAQLGTEPNAGASTGMRCLGIWCNPSAVPCHPSAGSTPLPAPGKPLLSPLLPGKSSFYSWHSPSVMAVGALIGFNCPAGPTWAPHPPIQQLHLNSDLSL